MTASQIIACAISMTSAIVSITVLVLAVRRARRQPVRWEIGGGMVTFDRKLTDEEIERFKAAWLRRYGNGRAHEVRMLHDEEKPHACPAYQPPTDPADSGLCARCGMYDHKHQEEPSA